MDVDELKQILVVFREEVREIADKMTADLLLLETASEKESTPLLESLFRGAHTIKGGAGSLGLEDVASLSHVVESLLGQCQRRERTFQSSFTDVVLAALDEIGKRLDSLLAGQTESAGGVRAVQARLQRVLAGENVRVEEGADGGLDAVGPTSEAFLRVGADRIESLSVAVDEFLVVRLRVAQRAAESARLAADLDLLVRRMQRGWAPETAVDLRRLGRDAFSVSRELSLETQFLSAMSDDLRENLRSLQVITAATVLDPFRRSVRDHARKAGVDTALDIVGSELSADRRILEGLRGALVHLLRNAVDHGIEPPAQRKKAGKPARARLRIQVEVVGSQLHISVSDDGRGLDAGLIRAAAVEKGILTLEESEATTDEAVLALIWRSGFSTAREVSDTSGRGVGLDAVRDSIVKLGGRVEVQSRIGEGSQFRIQVPLMVASAMGLLVEALGAPYLLPLASVDLVRRVEVKKLRELTGVPTLEFRGKVVPVIALSAALSGIAGPLGIDEERPLVCVVSDGHESIALAVDRIHGEREISIRPLNPELQGYDHLSGATRTGDGKVVLVLSVAGLIRRAKSVGRSASPRVESVRTVLVVDDAVTSRLLHRTVLEAAGYRVLLAADGEEALELAQSRTIDAVISDVRMPRMDGLELTRRIRKIPALADLPILLVTSLASDDDRREGLRAGATAYLVKAETPAEKIVDTLGGFL